MEEAAGGRGRSAEAVAMEALKGWLIQLFCGPCGLGPYLSVNCLRQQCPTGTRDLMVRLVPGAKLVLKAVNYGELVHAVRELLLAVPDREGCDCELCQSIRTLRDAVNRVGQVEVGEIKERTAENAALAAAAPLREVCKLALEWLEHGDYLCNGSGAVRWRDGVINLLHKVLREA